MEKKKNNNSNNHSSIYDNIANFNKKINIYVEDMLIYIPLHEVHSNKYAQET